MSFPRPLLGAAPASWAYASHNLVLKGLALLEVWSLWLRENKDGDDKLGTGLTIRCRV